MSGSLKEGSYNFAQQWDTAMGLGICKQHDVQKKIDLIGWMIALLNVSSLKAKSDVFVDLDFIK